jgi:hypothetical protein
MPLKNFRVPLPSEPFGAALAGAGLFLFLAALTGSWPEPQAESLFKSAFGSREVPRAQGAVRVIDSQAPAEDPLARADALEGDLAWLRARGAGAIVLEAWLDSAPGLESRAYRERLRARLESLPAGRARLEALAALSETAEEGDAADKLARSLKESQPLVLAFQALPGGGAALPEALKREDYTVSLRGELKTLPAYRPVHLPFAEALSAVALAGAVPPVVVGGGRVPVAVCVDGAWVDSLGLEGARLALGLPLDGLRYVWNRGTLDRLELQGRRFPLDGQGRLALKDTVPVLATEELARLRSDPVAAETLRGKVVFFRPWPTLLGEADSFEEQARLFNALTEGGSPGGEVSGVNRVLVCGLACAVFLAWAFLPLGAAALVFGGAAFCFLKGVGLPEALAMPTLAGLGACAAGLGVRIFHQGQRRQRAARLFGGKVPMAEYSVWMRRLRRGGAAEGAYAVAGPRSRLQGPEWEAWLHKWALLVERELPADAYGLFLVGEQAAGDMPGALLELSELFDGCRSASAYGTVSLVLGKQFGEETFSVQGPPKDKAVWLLTQAAPGQILLAKKDGFRADLERPEVKLCEDK